MRNAYKILVGKPEGKGPRREHRPWWVDNVRLDPREVWWERVYWIHLAHDRDQWRPVVNVVVNFRVP
jgi:hypothetical protein